MEAIQCRQTLAKNFGALLGRQVVVSVEGPAGKIFETEARQVGEILTQERYDVGLVTASAGC